MYIKKTAIQFDSALLTKEVTSIINNNSHHLSTNSGFNLIRADGKDQRSVEQFGCGSLYDYHKREWIARESDFNTMIDRFRGLYIESVIHQIRIYASQQYKCGIGRVRLMVLKPKSCLTWHTDVEQQMRFHIPIITNPGAMFIHQDPVNKQTVVSLMQDVGALYTFDATVRHTAINASQEQRVHLVACGY